MRSGVRTTTLNGTGPPPYPVSQSDPSDGSDLRAMTFNVRYDTPDDGDDAWHARRDRVTSVVRYHHPDVLGVQEPLAHQFTDLQEGLPGYDWVGVGRQDGGGGGEFGPVGYRADRFDRLDAGTFWLSESSTVPGSVGWDAEHPRMCTWVRLETDRSDERFVVATTHLDHHGERARRRGAALVRRRLTAVADGDPVVLGGDFNCTPDSPPYRVLTAPERTDDVAAGRGSDGSEAAGDERGVADGERDDTDTGDGRAGRRFVDTHRAASFHHGPTATFNQFETVDRKIDYVFVTPDVSVHRHAVVTDHWDGSVPSDHRPVVADLSL